MDESRFQRWLDAYVDAWKSGDESAIGELFSEDAEYRYHPWEVPTRGRDAIVASWLDEPDEPDSWTAEYRPWLVSGDDAVAIGVS
ncbi:MAG: nuclear transport factor 2 family protein, partial [Gaiellaceae bacterium]